MKHLQDKWSALDLRQRVVVSLATLAVIATLFAIYQMASRPSLSLLYSGLDGPAAGDVVQALEKRGATYEIRGNGIFVETSQRDALRMTMASEGLPNNTTKGYELLDTLNGFGTTSQMFDAAYWRAKEGELARTIVSSPHISSARVHIAHSAGKPFARGFEPSASVSVVTTGNSLPVAHARALKFLVASAVADLTPENVSIIDGQGGLIDAEDSTKRANISDEKAAALRQKVQNLLEARVGYGNAVVEISVETVTQSEAIREKRFDPEGRVVISTDTEERTNSSSEKNGGNVSVASNLPDGDSASDETSSNQENESRERVNYEVSETEREILKEPGAIKRLTVAVLVNGIAQNGEAEAVDIQPRPEEELEALKELVASAVGFDEARGDIITIKSMAFEPDEATGSLATGSFLDKLQIDTMSVIQLAVLALVALILGLFVLRPILSNAAVAPANQLAPPRRSLEADAPGDLATPALTGEIDDLPRSTDGMELVSADRAAGPNSQLQQSVDDPVERLRAMIDQRKDETVEILRSWLEPKEEDA